MTAQPIIKGICHVVLYAPNPKLLAEFYQDVLGLELVWVSRLNTDKVPHSVFLGTRSAPDHHHLEILANPENRYTAFQVDSLADLQAFYRLVVARGLPIRWALNHGISLAFYFSDPAGNPIKLFWSTGMSFPQPHGHPIDLSQPAAVLRQDIAALVAAQTDTES